ncbi:TauD/TfdA family dioxygenase [Neobacillus drentensis]|uniref:TauD/TfdA family dioxygenase n=1 Tax=Neobacillus drentensis TaxID=220684 RepID=UPI003000E5A7
MKSIHTEKINHPSAWKGSEIKNDDSWIYRLTLEDIKEIDGALRNVQMKGLSLTDTNCEFTTEDFPLPNFSATIEKFAYEIEGGRGFLLIKGLPVDQYSEEESSIIYYGLGLHMGTPITQNSEGHLLGHVKSQGLNIDNANVRGYQTNSHLPFHTDLSDVVGLLCLNKAKSGGHSTIVSSMAVYNEMLEKHPEYLGILCNDFYLDKRGEENPGESPVHTSPIFSSHEGFVSSLYVRGYIESAQLKTNKLLSKIEIEAMDILDSILVREDMRLDMDLEPGDIQLINNFTILHSRTEYVDYAEPKHWRHLLRLWINLPNARPISPSIEFIREGFKPRINA